MDSKTKDLVHFADIFHCDVTVQAIAYDISTQLKRFPNDINGLACTIEYLR